MGRKSRNTAKTGGSFNKKDTSQYIHDSDGSSSDDDNMYAKVDKFHLRKDEADDGMIRLGSTDPGQGDSDSEDEIMQRENVLDLGLDDDSEEEEDDETSSEEELGDESERSLSSSEDEESEPEEDKRTSLLDWGKRKSLYYHGDTADLEIGQKEEDAFVEEEAGKEVERMRMEGMDEEDFMPSYSSSLKDKKAEKKKKYDEDDPFALTLGEDVERLEQDPAGTSGRGRSGKLNSRKDRVAWVGREHEEYFALVKHFSENAVLPLRNAVCIVANQLEQNEEDAEAIGLTPRGKMYLQTLQTLLLTITLNLTTYLLFKKQGTTRDIQHHPLFDRLNEFDALQRKLRKTIEIPCNLEEQLDKLLKAVRLIQDGDSDQSDSDDESSEEESDADDSDEGKKEIVTDDSELEEESSDSEDEHTQRNLLQNEARFAVRPDDIMDDYDNDDIAPSKPHNSMLEYGDEEHDPEAVGRAKLHLHKTVNTINQKTKKKAPDQQPGDQETINEVDRAYYMAEGRDHDADMDEDKDEEPAEDDEGEGSDYDKDDDYYEQISKKSKSKKAQKKQMYTPALKYPKLDTELKFGEERKISKTILKNRGLVAHKPKINRNPRVKKREQYRKALIRRKGAVREVRTGEADVYGGETTGIKSGISRSRKLGVKY